MLTAAVACAIERYVLAQLKGQRRPALQRIDGSDRPAAQEAIGQMVAELERQLPEPRSHKSMAAIPIRAAALRLYVEWIGYGSSQIVRGTAVNRLAQRVRAHNAETARKSLGHLRLEAVIPATEVIPQQVRLRAQDARLEDHTVVHIL